MAQENTDSWLIILNVYVWDYCFFVFRCQNHTKERSFSDGEMVFPHGFREQIGLCGQTADIEVHDALWELFVLQSSWAVAVVLVEQRPDLIVLEHTSELVQSFLELFELNFAVVIEVEISQGLFGSLPFVGLSIWLFSDLFVNDFFELFESLRRNIVLRLDEIPGANQDVLQVLKLKKSLLFIFPVGYRSWVRHNNR